MRSDKAYNSDLLLTTVTNSSGITRLDYDSVTGRLVRVTEPDGRYVRYEYDSTGNETLMAQTPTVGSAELVTRYAFDEISMAKIASAAGISKALLYHYFPSKRDYFVATLASGAQELRAAVETQDGVAPAVALGTSVEAYLTWIDEHAEGYRKLMQSAAGIPEVRELVEAVRDATSARILDGLDADSPRARTAVRGWLWFMDGVIHDWLEHRDLARGEVRDLLVGSLGGALAGAA